jgi:hypothetical protein
VQSDCRSFEKKVKEMAYSTGGLATNHHYLSGEEKLFLEVGVDKS